MHASISIWKHKKMLNETLSSCDGDLVLQCRTPAALRYVITITTNKRATAVKKTCSLRQPPWCSAIGSDLERDLLDWKQSLEAVLPDKKAQAFRVSDDGSLWNECNSLWRVYSLSLFLRGHLLLKHATNHMSTGQLPLIISWNLKNTLCKSHLLRVV